MFSFPQTSFRSSRPVRRKLARSVAPSGVERKFDDDELIVSKTDLKGNIIYVNDVFLRIAGYRETDVLGAPHSIIRHPDMPRCVFKLLWQQLGEQRNPTKRVV